ncbi:FAD-dependent oxidoreductase [Sporomusa aerivorans]|uniref:FAD-dependent oxidoreductase n=1 Tax=Sporomusa aerivorans TaxID=204936 RepID=UPI00352A11D6
MEITEQLQTDILVIGAGSAGLRAALEAAEAGSRVLILNKGPAGKSGITLTAAGGMQVPIHPEDKPDYYFADTVRCGYDLGDQNLVRALVEEAQGRQADLERYGVNFVRDASGGYSMGQFPGQTRPRNVFIKGGGIGLVSALVGACKHNERITILDDFFVTGLVREDGSQGKAVAGAVGLNLKNGNLTLISAKATIMATGGCQWLWETTDCPADATGDGVVYAYRAGAELIDMEMVLFYPSVILRPASLKGAFVHYEFLSPDVLDGNVYDKDGQAVLPKPLPVRDQAMRLMAKAIQDGRSGPHGGLFWYVGDSPKGEEVVRKVLNTLQYNYIKSHGVNPAADKIEVAPGAHYLMGGIFINEECKTSIKGLFATPECAGNFDGANRLAGGGITATQVFGAKAGICAHKWARSTGPVTIGAASLEEEIGRVSSRIAGGNHKKSNIMPLREKLRSAVQQYAGVIRNKEGLLRLQEIAREIKEELGSEKVPAVTYYNQQLVDLLQLENMCEIAGLVAGCAQLRQESRGHHYRSDFPDPDNLNWLQHTLVFQKDGKPGYGKRPVVRIRTPI